MSISMHQLSIPVFERMLGNLSAIIAKAAAHAEARKIDPAVFVNARLAPDMFPFSRQVQIACDAAKGAGARLAGVEVPSHPDTESSFAELQERIAKTQTFLRSLSPAQFDGSEARRISLKLRDREVEFQGLDFLTQFALPNFYFHISAAYAILRHNGVDIGKRDYLGA
ncbi:DUF1993 domain-containing protein [Pseudomonas cavernae]|uniref:DUF1993 domain-containing protein n=1 Tax=Pseudomonas cavernae TaxID=2320867 RepID=A0A385Z7J7_9PSED|nr:DUF1993 domain-containing protein [Pseudomonas cavernae]AYC34711.1 DUF1993 domain-containing protein [Pseudomonas cavernae]